MERNGLDQAAVYIILLNWNSATDTLRCLRALTLLRGVQARVMVVDNGSEPVDLERLRSGIARWGLAVRLVETGENLGFGGGCNVGMRLALERGAEFVWLLNNDAVPHPDALQAMLRVMARDAQIAAVGSVIYDLERPERVQTWGGGRVWRWAGVARHRRRSVVARRLDYLTAASILLRREALEGAGLFDEDTFFMYWEDADLCFRPRAPWPVASDGSKRPHGPAGGPPDSGDGKDHAPPGRTAPGRAAGRSWAPGSDPAARGVPAAPVAAPARRTAAPGPGECACATARDGECAGRVAAVAPAPRTAP